jgi:hypothetical protein
MTQEEMALDLIEKFKINDYDWVAQGNDYCVKQHAVITVDVILTEVNRLDKKFNLGLDGTREYWDGVKTKIKNAKL